MNDNYKYDIPCCIGTAAAWGCGLSRAEIRERCTCKTPSIEQRIERIEKMFDKYLQNKEV